VKFWTTKENAVLRARYPTGGAVACAPKLRGRSPLAIAQHAYALGIKGQYNPRLLYVATPAIDAQITAVFTDLTGRGQVAALAKRLKVPRWWISTQATRLCLKAPRFKEPAWSAEELAIAQAHAHQHVGTIQKHLARAGYRRSETGIVVKLKRNGGTGRALDPDNYSATALAKLFNIDGHSVAAWVDKGWLQARMRGTKRGKKQGGDEHVIHRNAVRQFIIDNVHAVDFRKVDKFWLVEILTGGQPHGPI
jgi:hypothetical protein